MKSIYLKQSKATTIPILGWAILALTFLVVVNDNAEKSQIVIMTLLGLILLGYSISYEIRKDLNHKWCFQLFGITVFKKKLKLIEPDYIVVFSALFKKDADWGPVAALGNEAKNGTYVIRFFKGNTHFTVWKSKSLKTTKEKALNIGKLLDVEVKLKKR